MNSTRLRRRAIWAPVYRPDFDQLLSQRRQRPMIHAGWQCQATQEVVQVVRQHVQLQTHRVGVEAVARLSRGDSLSTMRTHDE